MKSCHYGSSCGHKQGKSVLSYPPGKHANLKTDFTARLCGKTRLDATHFVQPPSCPKPTSTPTFPHHNNEKSKKMPHFLSFNPDDSYPATSMPGLKNRISSAAIEASTSVISRRLSSSCFAVESSVGGRHNEHHSLLRRGLRGNNYPRSPRGG